jgi:hypothetical protein
VRPLFDEQEPGRKQGSAPKLRQLEKVKTRLLERLAEVAEQQSSLAREVYAVEREQKRELEAVEEHIAPEPLSYEDVERWVRTVFFSFARTQAANPHMYAARKRCDDAMFERIARYVQENGYAQEYGGRDYIVLDVDLHGEPHFVWTMGSPPSESQILNCKPVTLKLGLRPWAESPEG